VHLSTVEYAQPLAILTAGDAKADVYLKGGAVEELEDRFAKLLGKERGLFFPTGTLANHVAVRVLAGERRHVVVQEESHLYPDEGDCAQTLSGASEIVEGLIAPLPLLIQFRLARYPLNRPCVAHTAKLSTLKR
jgi:threonine aldolase